MRRAGRRGAATSRRLRRTSSSRSASSESAVETVGRRAPTSWPRIRWVSASGITTPSPPTRPQRSARCQNSAFRRRSTRVSCEIACVVASRSERSQSRSNSAAVTSGYCETSAAKRRSSTASVDGREHAPLGVDRQQLALRRRLPGADQIAGAEQLGAHVVGDDQLAGDARRRGRAGRCGRRSRPRGATRPRVRRARRCVLTSSRRSASERRGSASSPPRSGSALSREICSVLMRQVRGWGTVRGSPDASAPTPLLVMDYPAGRN